MNSKVVIHSFVEEGKNYNFTLNLDPLQGMKNDMRNMTKS